VRQVVFTYVLIVGRLDVDGQRIAPIGLHKTDDASVWLFIKRHVLIRKDCRESSHKINRITEAIGGILAFTGKEMFYFN
jgi:hypothetical protein